MEKVRTILNNIAKCTISAISENTILDPVSRAEHYLYCIATGGTEVLEPITRVEHYLYCIATGDISILEPIGEPVGRFEQYLKAIIDNNFEELPEPITRREHILYSAITGNTDDIPFEDIGSGGRFEEFLYQLALNGGIEYIISLGNDPTNIPLPNSVNGRAEVVEMGGNTLVNLSINKDFPYPLQNTTNTNQIAFALDTPYEWSTTKQYTLIFNLKDVKNPSGANNVLAFNKGGKDVMLPLIEGIQKVLFNPFNTVKADIKSFP